MVKYDHTAYKQCAKATGCELPLVRGDWFVFSASRPPLYHTNLEIPETETLLEQRLRVDVKENLRTNQVWRAGFNGSGVSDNNRLLERHLSPMTGGAYWKSYDFKGIRPDKPDPDDPFRDLSDHPLGPEGLNAFRHDGGEIIFHLPNGLQAYMLTATADEKGKRLDHGRRIDTGPTDVVRDPKQKESKVVNGISCMSCHAQGMIFKDDEIRGHVEQNAAAFSESEVRKVKLLYKPQPVFEAIQKQDAQRFADAVKKTGSHLTNEDPIVQLSKQFEAELDVELAAAEVGLPSAKFLIALNKVPALARKFGSLSIPGRTVKRDIFVAAFGDFVKDFGLGTLIQRGGETPPPPPPDAKLITSKSTGMKLTLIPAGTFTMGSPATEAERLTNEGPQHSVKISQAFYMGVYEVTQGEYESVTGTNPSSFSTVSGQNTSKFPVEGVSWFDAIEFCNKLSVKDSLTPYYSLTNATRGSGSIQSATVSPTSGNGYRLPTEAEWEYAARANTTTPFHFGGTLNGDKANVDGNYPYGTTTKGKYLERTATAGSYAKNDFGLFDMHGNVWEWCEDVYDEKVYGGRSGTTSDPKVTRGSEYRVLRGGSWYNDSKVARSAYRDGSTPGNRYDFKFGFRVVLSSAAVRTP